MSEYQLLGFKDKEAEFLEFQEKFYIERDILRYNYLKDKLGNIPLNDKNYYFLTINPNPAKTTLKDLMKACAKAVSKKWITYYEYVIEQRGETPETAGDKPHAHIIFNKGIKHCKVELEMKNTFKSLCDCSKDSFFNLLNIDDEEMKRKTSYILDRKSDPRKWLKQDMDVLFREKYGIQKSYKSY